MNVRIYQPARNAMQSGEGRTRRWVLEFVNDAPKPVDPLMGWTGSLDTTRQVRMSFETREEAVGYAQKHGLAFTLAEPHKRKKRPRSYGENFAAGRRQSWTH